MVPKKTFSIIIPVYNVERYLSQCVNSVLNQSFSNFELLLINDGSTDSSLKICNDFKEKDHRIVVIDKANGGASSARNVGIVEATGEYLIFVDSDDYIESKDLLLTLHSSIKKNNADVILYGGKNYNINTDSYTLSKGNYDLELLQKFDYLNTVNYLINYHLFPGSAWVFTVKTSVVKNNNLFFRTQIIAEDIDWVTKIFKVISKIDAVNDVFYVYRKNQSNSVTGNAGIKGVTSIMSIIEDWYPKLSDENPIDVFLLHNLGYYYFTSFVLFAKISKKENKDLVSRMKANFKVTKYVRTKKLKVLRAFCQFFGLNLTSMMISKLYTIKEQLV